MHTWYGGSRRGWWLLPLAWLYGLATGLRRQLYRAGILRAYRSPRPVVVVGNLTVGGTGKTPLVVWLAQQLTAHGWRVGVVSRGYGRRSGEPRRVAKDDDVVQVGDEPLLVARRTDARVAVASDRPAAVRLLEADCDLVLSDDGLQHYALAREFELVVVDGARGLGNGRLLPAGPLREPATRLAEADAVVINGDGYQREGGLRMRVEPLRFVNVSTGESRPLSAFSGRRVHAVAALGNPQRFFASLRALGVAADEHALPDHAVPGRDQLWFGDDLPVLMTEKDAVKCGSTAGPQHWYLEVGAAFAGDEAARLVSRVEQACGGER